MINAIIVETKPSAMHLLQQYICKYCPEVHIAGTAANANAAYKLILKHQPQLLFSNIETWDGDVKETSFDLLIQLPNYQYTFQAIRFQALNYLLRFLGIDKLKKTISLVKERLSMTYENIRLADLVKNIGHLQQENKRLWIPMGDGLEAVYVDHIIRFEAAGRCTWLHIKDSKKILSTRNLKEYVELLKNQFIFYHIHRSHFINTSFILKYVSTEGGYLLMADHVAIPIARRKKQQFMDWLLKV